MSDAIVRNYAEGDYFACRSLWAELTEYHRIIYGDSTIGGDDPGAGFDDYLAESPRMGSWVAESHGRVVGLTGLDLAPRRHEWLAGASLHGLDFDYGQVQGAGLTTFPPFLARVKL